uniref:adhesion G protein-coupled receptor E5 n=1 Tax=Semicossyphus pulcher TaxID=241346 RepID=UPI0037E92425
MAGRWILLILDVDECIDKPCGLNAHCNNTIGSVECECHDGFLTQSKKKTFSPETSEKCRDINECFDNKNICGANTTCTNASPYYSCTCEDGFISTGTKRLGTVDTPTCKDICIIDKTICGSGTCHHDSRGHYCACHAGYTNYGNKRSRCTALNCDVFNDISYLSETFHAAHDLVKQLNKSCPELTKSENPTVLDAEGLLERLLSAIDELLSSGAFKDNRKVSIFLDLVENTLKLIAPLMRPPGTNTSSLHTELQLWLHKGAYLPQRPLTLSSMQASLDIQMETAAGDPSSYPGFTAASLLSYANLVNDSLSGQADGEFKINSQVVTVSVSNTDTSHLKEPVKLTFNHLEKRKKSSHRCVFWNSSLEGGRWSDHGCSVVESNPDYTVCSCNHLSSFAVLMALYDIEHTFELQLITWVGLSLSLICLLICILTFWLIRSIHSTRTTIHLHLCISLFLANIIFLSGITRTENPVGCGVVAGFLHFFYLAAFCWMCLEGIQLFRMVVLVFNTSFKTLYMLAGGYGVPAVIVAISASANPKGYGTEKYCWLDVNFIWSFFGPACLIIIINIFFFLITVWKLAVKFSSLNPDLDSLQKIKVFTITAVAQLCVLGTMWIFGCFQFEERTIAMSYLFTIFGSFQGVMLFVMHCLFSKQVRDEYRNILAKCCAPRKKSYSNFSSSSSSKTPASKSHDTGESHV